MVELLCLDGGFFAFRVEPVHGVHDLFGIVSLDVFTRVGVGTYHSDSQAARLDPLDYLVDLVCMDAETIECAGRGQLHVGFGGEVCGMASFILQLDARSVNSRVRHTSVRTVPASRVSKSSCRC